MRADTVRRYTAGNTRLNTYDRPYVEFYGLSWRDPVEGNLAELASFADDVRPLLTFTDISPAEQQSIQGRMAVQRRISRYIARGYLANWRRQLQDGTREYRKALKLDPHDDGIKFALGIAAVHKRHALAALERRPDDIKSLSKLGYIAWHEQDYDAAIRRFRQVLAVDAHQPSAYIHLGVSYAGQANFDASIAAYQKAKELRADLAGVVAQSIDLVERLRRAKEHPNDPAAQERLGELYASDGRFDRAIECFEKVTSLAPDSPHGFFALARSYEAEERDAEALRAYDRGLALDPTHAQARNNREKLSIKRALELGQPVELALGADGVLTIDPDSAMSYYHLGLRYLRNDEADAAVLALRRAIALQPGHDAAHLFLGLAYTSLGTYADAEVEYRRAIALRPTNPEAYNYLGLVYYQQQRYRRALGAYRQAIAQAPGYAVAYVNLAASHEALGRQQLHITPLITTIAVAFVLQEAAVKLFGSEQRSFPVAMFDELKKYDLQLGAFRITYVQMFIIVASVVLMVGLYFFVEKTTMGRAMRACAENTQTARLLGVNVHWITVWTFGIASALAGAAGVLIGLAYNITPLMGGILGLKGLTIMLFGGSGNIVGAMVAALILGMIETMSVAYLVSAWKDGFAFGILILILLYKPTGLFGSRLQIEAGR